MCGNTEGCNVSEYRGAQCEGIRRGAIDRSVSVWMRRSRERGEV